MTSTPPKTPRPLLLGLVALVLASAATVPAASAAQMGDRAGETQAPLPEDLSVPPAPALTPEEELASFSLPEGFVVELVASEPLIHDPVQACFDARGRLWVVEMQGYMPNVDGTGEEARTGRVRVLEDTDGDGRMDRGTTFLDELVLPRSVLPMTAGGPGLEPELESVPGALVLSPPELAFWVDTDGDGAADTKSVVATGFGGIASPEHAPNGFVVTPDGWVRLANHGVSYRWDGREWLTRRTAGGGQWGIARDDLGRVFFNTNSDPLRYDAVPSHYATRNPNHGRIAGVNVQAKADRALFPVRINPGVNRAYRPETLRADWKLADFTGACAPWIQRGPALGHELDGAAFVCEPTGNLVKAYRLEETDAGLRAHNVFEDEELLASTDERFRPVNLCSGPDGALYVVDMYRGILQHRIFLTSFLRAQIVERGLDRPIGLGRIWRVRRADVERGAAPELVGASWTELATLLDDARGWVRDQAQRLFVEEGGGSRDALDLLGEATQSESARVRWHALWALASTGRTSDATLKRLLADPDPSVRRAAARASEVRLAAGSTALLGPLLKLAREGDALDRQQVLFSLGESRQAATLASLVEVLSLDVSTPELRSAALSSLSGRELELTRRLLGDPRWEELAPGRDRLLFYLARAVVRDGRLDRTRRLVDYAAEVPDWRGAALASGMLDGRAADPMGAPAPLWLDAEPARLAELEALEHGTELAAALAWAGRPGLPEAVAVRPLTSAERRDFERGKEIYATICAACHQPSGQGEPGKAPPLRNSPYVLGDRTRLARILTGGLEGPVTVLGQSWNQEMPALPANDADTAAVMTYIRRQWGHGAEPATVEIVGEARAATALRDGPWTLEALDD